MDKAIQAPHFEGLDTAIEGIQPLIEALVDECQEMTLIAERRDRAVGGEGDAHLSNARVAGSNPAGHELRSRP